MIKLYVDDVRPTPQGYVGVLTTNGACKILYECANMVEELDLDHDAGIMAACGGDYINILKELERLTRVHKMDFSHIKFRLHSANPVGVQNMRAIIEANGWKEVF